MKDLFSLHEKVIAITGGGGVLCREMARYLARIGAKVAILNRTEETARAVVAEIQAEGGAAMFCKFSALEKDTIQAACEAIEGELGPIYGLINGVGGNNKKATTSPELSFFDIPQEAFSEVFNANILSAVLACQVFGEQMVKRQEGVIVNISSMNAFRPLTRIPAYSCAKAALSNFTQWLAVHMCQNYSQRIRVNAIAPGFFLTDQGRFLLIDKETGGFTQRGQSIISHTPMGRFGDPQELLGTTHWLLCEASAFVTGTVVPVDGGFNVFSGV